MHRALKTLYDHEDNLVAAPHDISVLKEVVYKFFKLKERFDILPYLYDNFKKENMAEFCKVLSETASNTNDRMCCQLFRDAGYILGRHIVALLPKVNMELLTGDGGLKVVCVGSVFKSWALLREGFVSAISEAAPDLHFTLLTLQVSSAYGAAALGAKKKEFTLALDYASHTSVLYCHEL